VRQASLFGKKISTWRGFLKKKTQPPPPPKFSRPYKNFKIPGYAPDLHSTKQYNKNYFN